jgi:hypothetical protein
MGTEAYLLGVFCCFLVECRSILAVLVGLGISHSSWCGSQSRSRPDIPRLYTGDCVRRKKVEIDHHNRGNNRSGEERLREEG